MGDTVTIEVKDDWTLIPVVAGDFTFGIEGGANILIRESSGVPTPEQTGYPYRVGVMPIGWGRKDPLGGDFYAKTEASGARTHLHITEVAPKP